MLSVKTFLAVLVVFRKCFTLVKSGYILGYKDKRQCFKVPFNLEKVLCL